MVKIELGKRDFVWIGLIVILGFVGFGYAYNSGASPSVMGHSGEEIQLDGNTIVNDAFCQKITGSDCGSAVVTSYCGDGSCNNGESCSSCSGDCGACPVASYCGDGSCNGDETVSSCCEDCGTTEYAKNWLNSYQCCAISPGECITNVDGVKLCYGDSYPPTQCSTCGDGTYEMIPYCY